MRDLWEELRLERRPVVLYGTGDGADKLLAVCEEREIPVKGVLASPEFLRDRMFHGFHVENIEQAAQLFGDPVILVAFGSSRPEVLERVRALDRRFQVRIPDLPLYGEELFCREFLEGHQEELREVEGLLADGRSRETLRWLLEAKLWGRYPALRRAETPREEVYSLLKLSPGERVADLGAYTGDTLRELEAYAGPVAWALAVEPDSRNFRKLSAWASDRPEISPVQAAAWSGEGRLRFSQSKGRGAAAGARGTPVPADSLDHLLQKYAPPERGVSLIKLDVEGAEWEALQGCREALLRYRPKLMVAGYHRTEDLFRLPLLLKKLCPGRRIYLRRHPYIPAWETNFYVC